MRRGHLFGPPPSAAPCRRSPLLLLNSAAAATAASSHSIVVLVEHQQSPLNDLGSSKTANNPLLVRRMLCIQRTVTRPALSRALLWLLLAFCTRMCGT